MTEPAGFTTVALLMERLIAEVQGLRADLAEARKATAAPAAPTEPEGLWDVHQLADYLHASPSWVYDGTSSGRIPHLKVLGLLRFDPATMKAWALGKPPTPTRGGRVLPLTGRSA